jgi:branched-chain amino acid transport system ATP-binding protein
MSDEATLRLQGITKRFGGTLALSGVDLEARPGKVTSVIGPNGAGKSTIMNVIAGTHRPDQGRIFLGREELKNLSPRRARLCGITRTFQRCRVFTDLTCRENIRIGSYISAGRPRSARVVGFGEEELLEWSGLSSRRDTLAKDLALAERRRLEIARAIAAPAKVLLLDEPTAGMGQDETKQVEALVREAADQLGMAVILVAHDMDLVMSVSDWVTVLDFGTVIARGDPATVRHDDRVIEAYLGPEDSG